MDSTRWTLGVFFIVLVAVIWTLSSVLVQFVFNDLHFRSPFFVTWLATALFSVQLPLHFLLRCSGCARRVPWRNRDGDAYHTLRDATDPAGAGTAGGGEGAEAGKNGRGSTLATHPTWSVTVEESRAPEEAAADDDDDDDGGWWTLEGEGKLEL